MTMVVELESDHWDVVHELLLRGLTQTHPLRREYGETYDAFVEAAGYPLQIGDQPKRIRDAWFEMIKDSPIVTRTGETSSIRWCVECGEKLSGDIMIPDGHGPMHVECWKAWMK